MCLNRTGQLSDFRRSTTPLLNRLWPSLAKDHGRLLKRLLGRFLHTATYPNPAVLALAKGFGFDSEIQASAYWRLPLWIYWIPMLQFLHGHKDEAIRLCPPTVAEVCETWLRATPKNTVLRKEAADLALAIGEWVFSLRHGEEQCYFEEEIARKAYRAALQAAPDAPGHVERFLRRACCREWKQDSSKIRTAVKSGLITGAPIPQTWPDGPSDRVDDDLRAVCIREGALVPLINSNPMLAQEAILALLIKPPHPEDPFHADLFEGVRLEMADDHGFFPPFYDKGPFMVFLSLNPEQGADTIVTLVNFATERQADHWRNEGYQSLNSRCRFQMAREPGLATGMCSAGIGEPRLHQAR